MTLSGELLIAGTSRRGMSGEIVGFDAASGEKLPVSFGGATAADLEEAAALAWEAFPAYRETTLEHRALFLETIAEESKHCSNPFVRGVLDGMMSAVSSSRTRGKYSWT